MQTTGNVAENWKIWRCRFKPGKDLILADALSRAYVIHNEEDDFDKDIESQICLKSQVYKKKLNIKQTEQPYENHYSLPAGKNVKNNAIDNKNRRDEVKYFIELDIEPEKRETQNDAYLCMNSGNDSDEGEQYQRKQQS
ncbi:hypothetical protein HUJ05_002536 [Dendroctonus ponderosae]|nr:hypothetical protein HUJ05_002536 [Dendroctonus ponderosae]